ncbi:MULTISPECIES: AI-2E family transporter [Haloferax]|uniref:AI-2E family transporter n=2 Tax=Haloferax TaxID=2251 RepID=A0A6G1YYC5_9EURY|nr:MULTISPECIES: AI-2E family transporter [Haloferax]KAB1186647.1 AI-2E family transporter [Haloferax sp. CBA1149]MRW79266.1 AI-2E family transporter [Haloferax marinisediminis]
MNSADGTSSRSFLLLLLILFGTLSVFFVLPFLQPVLLGGLLAYLVYPVNQRLTPRLGRTGGAAVTMLATITVIVVPLLFILSAAASQAATLLRGAKLPDTEAVDAFSQEQFGTNAPTVETLSGPVSNAVQTGIGGVVGDIGGILSGISAFLVGGFIFLFTLFFLLRDGNKFIAWLRTAVPLDTKTTDALFERTNDLLWAAVIGNVIVAAVQAILTVLGFLVIGFDNLIFWGVTTFVLSLLPVIGASVVWIPAVIYLVFVGSIPEAVGLLIYGSFIISGSDNIIRPLAMERGAKLNSGILILSIFGGVAVFGFIGLFVGPVVIGLTKTIVELLADKRADPSSS